MRVQMQDGAVFVGENAKQIVAQMRADDWSSPPKKKEYMEEVAERVNEITAQTVRATDAETFLNDLQVVGLCSITEN